MQTIATSEKLSNPSNGTALSNDFFMRSIPARLFSTPLLEYHSLMNTKPEVERIPSIDKIRVLKELNVLASYDFDWNCDDGEAADPSSFEVMRLFVEDLYSQRYLNRPTYPRITMLNSGGVGLSWDNGLKSFRVISAPNIDGLIGILDQDSKQSCVIRGVSQVVDYLSGLLTKWER